MIDEIYVKAAISYHGGAIFGKAVDAKSKLTQTMLSVMLKSLYGGPEFIFKAYPV